MKKYVLLSAALILSVSCSTDFAKTSVDSHGLVGYIEGGNAAKVYTSEGFELKTDTLRMDNWSLERMVENINIVRDTNLRIQSGFEGHYSAEIFAAQPLGQREFVDSLIVTLTDLGLVK